MDFSWRGFSSVLQRTALRLIRGLVRRFRGAGKTAFEGDEGSGLGPNAAPDAASEAAAERRWPPGQGGPPEHWLKVVRERAPQLLESSQTPPAGEEPSRPREAATSQRERRESGAARFDLKTDVSPPASRDQAEPEPTPPAGDSTPQHEDPDQGRMRPPASAPTSPLEASPTRSILSRTLGQWAPRSRDQDDLSRPGRVGIRPIATPSNDTPIGSGRRPTRVEAAARPSAAAIHFEASGRTTSNRTRPGSDGPPDGQEERPESVDSGERSRPIEAEFSMRKLPIMGLWGRRSEEVEAPVRRGSPWTDSAASPPHDSDSAAAPEERSPTDGAASERPSHSSDSESAASVQSAESDAAAQPRPEPVPIRPPARTPSQPAPRLRAVESRQPRRSEDPPQRLPNAAAVHLWPQLPSRKAASGKSQLNALLRKLKRQSRLDLEQRGIEWNE